MWSDELKLTLRDREIPVRFAETGIEWAADQIAQLLPARPRVFVICDSTVALLYEWRLVERLRGNGLEVTTSNLEPGEEHKTWRTVSRLLDKMAEEKLSRDTVVVGLGGGVATDIAGFAASIYERGLRWIAVPTSLLGMVDAAIGGKTGVNHPLAKNMIGTFHHPLAILAPVDVLKTLPVREWNSGSAELVKAALLSGGELWEQVERHGPNLLTWPREILFRALVDAARVKVQIVAQDERESSVRRLLNLGHTFGHALEAATHYEVFRHGEAVFLGLRAAVKLSEMQGLMPRDTASHIERILSQAVTPAADVNFEVLLAVLQHDKKIRSRALNWVLLRMPGEPKVTPEVSDDTVQSIALWLCEQARSGIEQGKERTIVRVLILNGPNLNLLGERETEIYGRITYAELEERLHRFAEDQAITLLIRQSNVEGELVNLVQQSRYWADGIIINPGAYTHTSVAIRDALAAVTLPAVEVHLTDVAGREEFRHVSLTAPVCAAVISGQGTEGYFEALHVLKRLIEKSVPLRTAVGIKDMSEY